MSYVLQVMDLVCTTASVVCCISFIMCLHYCQYVLLGEQACIMPFVLLCFSSILLCLLSVYCVYCTVLYCAVLYTTNAVHYVSQALCLLYCVNCIFNCVSCVLVLYYTMLFCILPVRGVV